ncbi:MAG: ABC transporter substrate-binding protein [Acholeplasmatales bacterium]|nr:ABC transporter substrate-binding protein [Acholeplasmatales bacterium]
MKKRILRGAALVALGGLAVAGLASCGEEATGGYEFPTPTNWVAPTTPTYSGNATDGGSVVNIRVWNDEFIGLFKKYYPNVVEVKANEEYTVDGLTVKFNMVSNQENAYQNALDAALDKQATAAADDKIDMFLMEADYALKYVNSNASLDVKDLGLTDDDTKDMYQYTKDVATSNGRLKGVSWQATPGLFAYRADIAKEVLGTDDPTEVQKKLSNWDKFDAVAADMKAKGYTMLSGFDDSYRTFSNNVSKPLVDAKTGTLNLDAQIDRWIKQTKEYTEKGYNKKTSLWDAAWQKEQSAEGKTFGFFYSTWGINFTLKGNAGKELFGKYRVCEGPASYFWGGTWLAAANGTDNKSFVAKLMKTLTCDATVAETITRETEDYTNNKTAMNKLANDSTYGSEFLGGQNHVALFAAAAPKIKMDKITIWDQGFNENIQGAFKDYFNGNATYDEAKKAFYNKFVKVYPEFE